MCYGCQVKGAFFVSYFTTYNYDFIRKRKYKVFLIFRRITNPGLLDVCKQISLTEDRIMEGLFFQIIP